MNPEFARLLVFGGDITEREAARIVLEGRDGMNLRKALQDTTITDQAKRDIEEARKALEELQPIVKALRGSQD